MSPEAGYCLLLSVPIQHMFILFKAGIVQEPVSLTIEGGWWRRWVILMTFVAHFVFASLLVYLLSSTRPTMTDNDRSDTNEMDNTHAIEVGAADNAAEDTPMSDMPTLSDESHLHCESFQSEESEAHDVSGKVPEKKSKVLSETVATYTEGLMRQVDRKLANLIDDLTQQGYLHPPLRPVTTPDADSATSQALNPLNDIAKPVLSILAEVSKYAHIMVTACQDTAESLWDAAAQSGPNQDQIDYDDLAEELYERLTQEAEAEEAPAGMWQHFPDSSPRQQEESIRSAGPVEDGRDDGPDADEEEVMAENLEDLEPIPSTPDYAWENASCIDPNSPSRRSPVPEPDVWRDDAVWFDE